jgi:L-ascorbate metabolism protein UlaG (beta-lactamase superfamily)
MESAFTDRLMAVCEQPAICCDGNCFLKKQFDMATLTKLDAAMLPIGAYAPRWFMAAAHMDPDEAVMVHQMLGCPKTLGFHWGTFQLTDEPMMEPLERLEAALQREGISADIFRTLDPGESWVL